MLKEKTYKFSLTFPALHWQGLFSSIFHRIGLWRWSWSAGIEICFRLCWHDEQYLLGGSLQLGHGFCGAALGQTKWCHVDVEVSLTTNELFLWMGFSLFFRCDAQGYWLHYYYWILMHLLQNLCSSLNDYLIRTLIEECRMCGEVTHGQAVLKLHTIVVHTWTYWLFGCRKMQIYVMMLIIQFIQLMLALHLNQT